ncbi:hypothetical protein COL5a_002187 [Colletotrichum fioriniae]|nr:hypothetical protein COL5a_002187 [Colletotrichum fioriniae]
MSAADEQRPNGHPHSADPSTSAAATSAPPTDFGAAQPSTTTATSEPIENLNADGPTTNGHAPNGTTHAPAALNGNATTHDAPDLNGHSSPSPNGAPAAAAATTANQQINDGTVPSTTNGGPPTNEHEPKHGEGAALENKIEGVQNPDANGHKPPNEKPHHHSSDLKGLYSEGKEKVKDKTKPSGGFDPTPLPDAPPGYTVRFIFHKATNLPAADIGTQSSDPFIHVTLRAAVPKRHKEDPDLTLRTQTIRKTTEPVWDTEWVVANVPADGFILKCRLYDEDWPDHDDRLGNVTVRVPHVGPDWKGYPRPGQEFTAKKRMGSKRAYFVKAITSHFDPRVDMSPRLWISMELLGQSDPPHAQMCTLGPTTYFKHFSPMIGRLTGIKVNRDEENDGRSDLFDEPENKEKDNKTQKYE